MAKKILIIDDEENIVDILKFHLEKNCYEIIFATDGAAGLQLALTENPDLILLDIMLPELDGFDVCKKVREQQLSVPIIMLTSKDDEVDKILGLELGADDYMTKPFSARELIARIRANLRRTEVASDPSLNNKEIMRFSNLTIDPTHYSVKRDGESLSLSIREFELLKYMALSPGEVFTRKELLQKVWGYEFYGDERIVDVSIRRLREKVESDTENFKYILTKRGVGYYFNNDI